MLPISMSGYYEAGWISNKFSAVFCIWNCIYTLYDPVSMGTFNPRSCRSVVCSRLRLVSMGTLKPPYSRSVV